MRIQVYQEELGPGIQLIQQTSRNGETFYGLRVWLETPQTLLNHSTTEDDDRSAVTFWADSIPKLQALIDDMQEALQGEE